MLAFILLVALLVRVAVTRIRATELRVFTEETITFARALLVLLLPATRTLVVELEVTLRVFFIAALALAY
jgi:hypothetical protein